MTKAQIIDKYIQRIMVDYPEADKIHIDLVQFAEELRQCDVSSSFSSESDHICMMYLDKQRTCMVCGKQNCC